MGLTAVAEAAPLYIVGASDATTGSNPKNFFNDGSGPGGLIWGNDLGYFLIDAGYADSNIYDPDTGAFELHLRLFADRERTEEIGTALGTRRVGDPEADLLRAARLDYDDAGEQVGSIDWTFDIADDAGDPADFYSYLETQFGAASGGWNVTTRFADKHYSGMASNQLLLDASGGWLYLLGTDGSIGGDGLFTGQSLSVNLGLELSEVSPNPEPSTLLLLTSGLLGMVGYRRRRRQAGTAAARTPQRATTPSSLDVGA
jgi:hypothetical protein